LGDFNLPDISWSLSTDSLVSTPLSDHDFVDGLLELSIQQVSFIRNSLNRQLDLVYVLDPSEVTVSRIDPLVVPEDQYHPTSELTICLPCVDTLSPSLSPIKSRCFRKCDFSRHNNLISQYNWTNLYNCLDIESATEPWFTNQLQRLRNLKTNFYKKYKKSGRPSDFSRYVVARTNFNVLNSHYYSMYLNRCKFEFSKDPRQFYNCQC